MTGTSASREDVRSPNASLALRAARIARSIASGPDRESFIHDAYFIVFTRANEAHLDRHGVLHPSDALATR